MALVAAHVEEVRLQICEYRFQSGWRGALDEPLKNVIAVRRPVERFEAYVAPKRAQDCPSLRLRGCCQSGLQLTAPGGVQSGGGDPRVRSVRVQLAIFNLLAAAHGAGQRRGCGDGWGHQTCAGKGERRHVNRYSGTTRTMANALGIAIVEKHAA